MATYKINNYINELLNEANGVAAGGLGYAAGRGLGKLAKKPDREEERGSQQQTGGSNTSTNTNTNTNTQNVGNFTGNTQRMGDQIVNANPIINVNTGSGSAGNSGVGGGNPLTNPYRPGGSKEIGIGDAGGEEKPEKPTPPEAMPQPKPIAPKPEPKPIAPAPKPEPTPAPTPTPVPGDPGGDPGYRGLPPFFKPGPYDQSDEDGNRIPGRPPAKPAPAPRPRPDLVPDLDDTKPPAFDPGTFGQNPFAQPGPGQTRGPRRRPIPPPSFQSGGGDFFPMESLSLESRRRGVREVYSSGLDVVLSTINERRREERGGMSNRNTQNVGNFTGNTQRMGDQIVNANPNINFNTGSGRAGGNYTQPAPQQPQQPQQPAPQQPAPAPTPMPGGGKVGPRPGGGKPGGGKPGGGGSKYDEIPGIDRLPDAGHGYVGGRPWHPSCGHYSSYTLEMPAPVKDPVTGLMVTPPRETKKPCPPGHAPGEYKPEGGMYKEPQKGTPRRAG